MKRRIGVHGLFRRQNSKKAAAAEAGQCRDDHNGVVLTGRARDSDAAVIFATPQSRAGAVAPTQVIDIDIARVRSDAASATVSTLSAGGHEVYMKRYADGCAAGIGHHDRFDPKYSPDGASKAFESAHARYHARRGDPLKEVGFRHRERGGSEQVREEEGDARTAQSNSSLFDLGLSRIDDNSRTTCTASQSSPLFPHDEEFEDVSLEPESTTLEETLDETPKDTLDETMTSSYAFELINKDSDWILGVGQYATRPDVDMSLSPSDPSDGWQGRSSFEATDGTAPERAGCPLPPWMDEEVLGSCSDLQSAFWQVLHAFFISEGDVDAIADRVRDAKAEVRDIYRQQLEQSLARQSGDLHFE